MTLIRSLQTLAARSGTGRRVVTIGAFDGLHVGHRAILERALGIARERAQPLTVLSFEPTPAEFFARSEPPARLTCFRERFELLADMGIDELFCPQFQQITALEHGRFVEQVLVAGLGVSQIVVGHDFRFGARREGSLETLDAAGSAADFGLTVVDAVYLDSHRVSSTGIRTALSRGDLSSARQMLGRDYSMSGRVVHGRGLGREFGFPTANVNLKRRRAPVDGIFAVQVDGLAAEPLNGVASVGNRPTVGGAETLLEVYLFDFDSQIYGEYITVRFLSRLRSEVRFATIEAMQIQMHEDVVAAKAALAGRIA
jgi:riboflavin kinase/FMN adenylyltransferase